MEEQEIQFYKKLAEENRGTPRQIGYGSAESQNMRFLQMFEVLYELMKSNARDLSNPTFLDFGCGKADLYFFLEKAFDNFTYIGVDAIVENVEDAKQAVPDSTIKLINWEGDGPILDEEADQTIDFVLFSGPFATTRPSLRNKILTQLIGRANIGIVGTFLRENASVDKYEEGCIFTNPCEIINLIDPAKFRYAIRAHYMPHDFTIGAAKW